ncbi:MULTISPECIES: glycosyltransferase family 4 protein [Flavobacterium]|uniref:Glycosyl transferase family 1 domain-containing protein n=1 Tax=Flavobacterium hankyongi TaxID=1176532 RepID=A0ABP9A287_9FLAO|nr:glycosyltransferase [Flavobacterium sp. N1846]
MKKKILIAGPIGDFGGRELEVNIIANALKSDFDVSVLSTGYMTGHSFALKNLNSIKWESVPKKIISKNFLLFFLSFFTKIVNRGKLKNYAYLKNSISKKLFDLDKLYQNEIEKQIKESDLVLLCVQLTSKFLPEIVSFCERRNIPCLVRTTGTIREVSILDLSFLKKVSMFIHHSEKNAYNLNKQINLPYIIIDQCALNEDKFLASEIKLNKDLRFGYLGRLTSEKGILPTAEFFSKTNLPFVIAGDGNQKKELLEIIADKSNCKFMGSLINENLNLFFNEIDVLVIPSYEESGPLVGLEAMAAGKIIISTKVGAMEERLNKLHCFWFQIEDLSTLELAIRQVLSLNESERLMISKHNRERYLDYYSIASITEKYLESLNKIKSF